jgi:hypothetical protein
MNAIVVRYTLMFGLAAAGLVVLGVYSHLAEISLQRSEFVTGYALFGLLLLLAMFNARKKLPMLPLARSAYWLAAHVVGGLAAIGLFFIHTGSIWPTGAYEQALAIVFYLVSLSGIFGYVVQRIYPRRLVQTDFEIIFERIPEELAEIREETEMEIRKCTEETGSDTLARHYIETLSWYFRRPRFFLNSAFGGDAGNHWLRNQYRSVNRYLNDAEKAYLDRISNLARMKAKIDIHYACQSVMKVWLLLHLPIAAALLGLMFWHVIVVNVYAI